MNKLYKYPVTSYPFNFLHPLFRKCLDIFKICFYEIEFFLIIVKIVSLCKYFEHMR